jgi:hypothetical protein
MRRIRLAAVVLAGMSLFVATATAALAVNPPGNNGTVKVDGIDVDNQQNANEPHVGCDFSIEWYGFDANAVSMVTFESQPPTSNRPLLTESNIQLDGDDNSGGGSPAGLDGVRYYQLQFDPSLDYLHPQQGYHVYLTVNTTGSQGSDVKHKVFWVTGCETPPPPV